MASRVEQKKALREQRLEHERQQRAAERSRALRKRVYTAVAAGALVLAVLFAISNAGGGGSSAGGGGKAGGGKYPYQVGTPGPGRPAPAMSLPSTAGGRFDLGSQRGKTVLLFFQEGIGCQPCWDQIKDLEKQRSRLKALGVDRTISVTTNELGLIRQKATDDGIRTPVLADTDLAVSRAYGANQYGMMGQGSDGHSFVVIGPAGRIRWRADYGGPPNYTMYVPIERLLSDMRRGLRARA